MQITSNYYRCRAQRAALYAESTAQLGVKKTPLSNTQTSSQHLAQPLRPSLHTLRSLANLHKYNCNHRPA